MLCCERKENKDCAVVVTRSGKRGTQVYIRRPRRRENERERSVCNDVTQGAWDQTNTQAITEDLPLFVVSK